MPIVTRFAPSPTGLLHLGHAHAALFARARAGRGRFLLRVEDIDPGRCRPEFSRALLDDLAWLGLRWDGVRVQGEHVPEYRAALATLAKFGLLYPCFCTRADIAAAAGAPHGPESVYPGTCRALPAAQRARRIAAGAPHAWRLDNARARATAGALTVTTDGAVVACEAERFGDVVLARRDAPASYHLCATHDDAAQGVTLVTRGVDLAPFAHLHRLLQAVMNWPAPAYAHHPLLTDAAGRRLSKRDQACTVASLREQGRSPAEVRAMAGFPEIPN